MDATQIHPSYRRMLAASGWTTECQRSPTKRPDHGAIISDASGWEPCPYDRGTPGYEYAVAFGCRSLGFRGRAEKVYYRRMRRLLAIA